MSLIYAPRGKAGEYAALAVNIYRGCGHRCAYCYAPDFTYSTRERFAQAEPRKDFITQLQRDLRRMMPGTTHVQLCFTCDPYQPIDRTHELTRATIRELKAHGWLVSILTKGGTAACRDFDLLTPDDKFGTTLTFTSDRDSLAWEPHAALPGDRIEAIRRARDLGIPTWVSLEPVIDPRQTLDLIDLTHELVDEFKVGKLNYHPLAKETDWAGFARDAVAKLEALGKRYYIKKDLMVYLDGRSAAKTAAR